MNRIPITEVPTPSPLDLISDGDFHTRETALLASYGRQGIDLGQTTRDRFTLADCSSMALRNEPEHRCAAADHALGFCIGKIDLYYVSEAQTEWRCYHHRTSVRVPK